MSNNNIIKCILLLYLIIQQSPASSQILNGNWNGKLAFNKKDSLSVELILMLRPDQFDVNQTVYSGQIITTFKGRKKSEVIPENSNESVFFICTKENSTLVSNIKNSYQSILAKLKLWKTLVYTGDEIAMTDSIVGFLTYDKEEFKIVLHRADTEVCNYVQYFQNDLLPHIDKSEIDLKSCVINGEKICANINIELANLSCQDTKEVKIIFKDDNKGIGRTVDSIVDITLLKSEKKIITKNICMSKEIYEEPALDVQLFYNNKKIQNKKIKYTKAMINGAGGSLDVDIMNSTEKPLTTITPERFNFLLDSLNKILYFLNSKYKSPDQFINGVILDPYTKVESSGWITYRREQCGWPYGEKEYDWKSINFFVRKDLNQTWKNVYTRILMRSEFCDGGVERFVFKRNFNGLIFEEFLDGRTGEKIKFNNEREAVIYLDSELRDILLYPEEKENNDTTNVYSRKKKDIFNNIEAIKELGYNSGLSNTGCWISEYENMIYFVSPDKLFRFDISYPALFKENGTSNQITYLPEAKINTNSFEMNWQKEESGQMVSYKKMWLVTRSDKNYIYFKGNKKWKRIGSDGKIIPVTYTNKFFVQNQKKPGVNTTPSGLQYEIIIQGNGIVPQEKDRVIIDYSVELSDGTIIANEVFENLKVSRAFSGLSEALLLMPEGSKLKCYLSSGLWNDLSKTDQISKNAVLILNVSLRRVIHE